MAGKTVLPMDLRKETEMVWVTALRMRKVKGTVFNKVAGNSLEIRLPLTSRVHYFTVGKTATSLSGDRASNKEEMGVYSPPTVGQKARQTSSILIHIPSRHRWLRTAK
jgi:hypothetical protein